MKKTIICFAVAALLTIPCLAVAGEHTPLSGTISAGAIIIDSANNLNPNGSKSRIDNLDRGADRETSIRAIALPRVTWDVGNGDGLKLHLITDPPIDEAGSFTIDTGISYNFSDLGIVSGGIYFTPFEEVWENPYVTGTNREEADVSKYGARLGVNKILGTGLRTQLVYLKDDVDNDIIGALEPKLARDGAVYSLNMSYSYYFDKNLELRPRLSIRKGEYDGNANSFTKYKAELEARYSFDRIMLIPRLHYSHSDYDATDPVFDKTRKVDGYGVSMMTTYMAPFNFTNWSLSGLLVLSKGDANIDFYDDEAMTFGALVNYRL